MQIVETFLSTIYTQQSNAPTAYQRRNALRDAAVIELLFATGIRITELCSLKEFDINLYEKTILIYGKGAKERKLQIGSDDVVIILQEYKHSFMSEIQTCQHFFVNQSGRPLSDQAVRRMINKYSSLAAIELHITPHMFRHTFATSLLEADVDIRYIQELMGIFLAVMVTDVVLLDIFNSLGMPTSTTVSMVFELLGGTFVLALIKIAGDETGMLGFADLLNTEKALSVILGIFLSVAVAFFFGTLVQYLSRLLFTFNYTKKLKYTIGLFGGIAVTAIIYFMLIKGLKDSAFMTTENKHWIQENTLMLVSCSFVFFTILMQILHWCKINVFKVVVMLGTFALAMAFAGNDLVNFIGVPLAGFSAYTDFMANGNGEPMGYLMNSLNGPAKTPFLFLFLAISSITFEVISSNV